MKLLEYKLGGMLAGLLLLQAASACVADEPAAGVVRISDASKVSQVNHSFPKHAPVIDDGYVVEPGVPYGTAEPDLDRGYTYFSYAPVQPGCKVGACLQNQETLWRTRNAYQSHLLGQKLRCTFSFLRPLTFWDAGATYQNIAVDPGYSDPRDSQYYAVEGYGVPLSVPLAPNVRGAYNYSWGVPSSRITPLGAHPGK